MKLMVIDGNSIVNRAFYGVRMLNTKDGTPTNGIFGFLNILQKLMHEENPDALCVTFDLKAPTFRHEKYDGYKAQRKGMPEELAVQMPILKEVLDAMNIPRYELSGWEADDLIGTIARKCEAEGWQCIAVTGDKDSFQLIGDNTFVKHVKTRMGQTETVLYTPNVFREEYGFDPIHMIDLKALMGDTSDNIPGVAGVGEKTATDLIRRFNSIEKIYAELDTLDIKDSVRKKLAAGKESAQMSYDLAEIRCCAPIEFSASDNKVQTYDNDKLFEIFKRLEFFKMIEKMGLHAPQSESVAAAQKRSEFEKITVSDAKELISAVEKTDVISVYTDDVEAGLYVCIADKLYVLESGVKDYKNAVKAVFESETSKCGHGVKDLHGKLLKMGINPANWLFDTEIAAYLLSPTDNAYPIERLAEQYLGYSLDSDEDESGQLSFLDGDMGDKQSENRAEAIASLYPVLEKELSEKGLLKLFQEIEMPLCAVLAEMEQTGFLVDKAALKSFGEMLKAGLEVSEQEIFAMAGESFNINSPKQLGNILFEKLMLPAPKKTKTGYSTSAEVLEKLMGKHPIIEHILNYRQLSKLKSTYADGLTSVIAPDGRIHTSFQMTVTATGRLSSTEPNLQNIPVRTELGGEIRKMFIAPEGKVLVDADYSQIELRLLSHISGDEAMRNAFITGEDVHAVTASQVFDVPLNEVTKLQRSHAKAVNFGIVYGISAFSLSQDINVSVAEAKRYMESYLEKYSGVRDYMQKIVEKAKEDGFVATEYGRRRALPELKSSNFNLRSFGERVALNMPIQGTAADIMKIAMIKVDKALKEANLEAKLILQVHDELIVECPENEAETVMEILVHEMSSAAQLSIPLTAEAKIGKSWYEAK